MHRAITGTPNNVSERLDRFAEELEAAGVLDDAWRKVLRAAPRNQFVPARAWIRRSREVVVRKRATEELVVWLSDPARSSWALVHSSVPFGVTAPGGTRFVVEQHGPRRLWDEVETVHRWWQHAGRPDRLRFGLTVTSNSQIIWLDDPGQPVVWLYGSPAPAFIGTTR
jgi:hypothetical protein